MGWHGLAAIISITRTALHCHGFDQYLLDRLLYSAVWGTNEQADSSPTVQYCAGQTYRTVY